MITGTLIAPPKNKWSSSTTITGLMFENEEEFNNICTVNIQNINGSICVEDLKRVPKTIFKQLGIQLKNKQQADYYVNNGNGFYVYLYDRDTCQLITSIWGMPHFKQVLHDYRWDQLLISPGYGATMDRVKNLIEQSNKLITTGQFLEYVSAKQSPSTLEDVQKMLEGINSRDVATANINATLICEVNIFLYLVPFLEWECKNAYHYTMPKSSGNNAYYYFKDVVLDKFRFTDLYSTRNVSIFHSSVEDFFNVDLLIKIINSLKKGGMKLAHYDDLLEWRKLNSKTIPEDLRLKYYIPEKYCLDLYGKNNSESISIHQD